jgi:PEP-CTERM motif-containing protein
MNQATFWTAAAAAVTFGAIDAHADTLNYSLSFTFNPASSNVDGSGSSGTGAFSIDSADLAGNSDITDPSKIQNFAATFSNVPGFGTLSFDQSDLDSVLLKHTEQTITGISFGTSNNGTDPFLIAEAFSTTGLSDGEATIGYDTTATLIPEPGSLALLAAGAAGVPLIRRRRARG